MDRRSTRERIGAPLRRVEDRRFLLGPGRFRGRHRRSPGALACVLVRSPHAHARIRGSTCQRHIVLPGVVAVLHRRRHGSRRHRRRCGRSGSIRSRDGTPDGGAAALCARARHRRHVGEPVVAVIADTLLQATDAAERVVVDYEPLPAVTDAPAAQAAGAPQLHAVAPGNVCFRWARGDESAVRGALRRPRTCRDRSRQQSPHRRRRSSRAPRWRTVDPASTSSRSTARPRRRTTSAALVTEQLGIAGERAARHRRPTSAAASATRASSIPRKAIVTWAARRLRRPVRWIGTRAESFVADNQARDHLTHAELALDADGHFLALHVQHLRQSRRLCVDLRRGYPERDLQRAARRRLSHAGDLRRNAPACSPTRRRPMLFAAPAGRRPATCWSGSPTVRPQKLGLDRAEIRRRNLIPPSAMPYKTPIGPTYDCGDFPKLFARALTIADYDGFDARRARAAKRGRLRGIGIACYVEILRRRAFAFRRHARRARSVSTRRRRSASSPTARCAPRSARTITARATPPPLRRYCRRGWACRSSRSRSSRATPISVPYGTGTFGSRSIAVGGIGARSRRRQDRRQGQADRRASAGGVGRRHRVRRRRVHASPAPTVACRSRRSRRAAYVPHNFPLETVEPGLQDTAVYDPPNFAFSNGAHVCELEIDPDTGRIELVGFWAVDDIGTVINPMIVDGQIAWRRRAGLGPGAVRALRLRWRWAARLRLVHGLRDRRAPTTCRHLSPNATKASPARTIRSAPRAAAKSGAIGAPAAVVSAALDALARLASTISTCR